MSVSVYKVLASCFVEFLVTSAITSLHIPQGDISTAAVSSEQFETMRS